MDIEKLSEERDDFIKTLIKVFPKMKTLFLDMKTKDKWLTEKELINLTLQEKKKFNLRKQLPEEVILDLEEKYRIEEIQNKLDSKEWTYKIWETGSRGYHINIIFNQLKFFDKDLRERIKKYIITDFGVDVKLAKESQWLALELTPHFKTGITKTLFCDIQKVEQNVIPMEIINYCRDEITRNKEIQIKTQDILKDYSKKDPYLKYILENTIESGERNNVLFKNIAIGLVLSGLTRDEIQKFAINIVNSCPGKNVGEFMGWVDKTIKGDLTEYNRDEMVKWSIRYNHPILYELTSDEEPIDFMSIKQLWETIWKHRIAEQPIWKDMCFYNLIGTILDEKKADLRIHLIFSSYSTTGKDEGINLIREILDRLNYRTRVPSNVTDRTLVGSYNQHAIEYNTKWGLDKEKKLTDGKHEFKDPVEEGWLAVDNWIAFPECEFVLRPGNYNRGIQVILRQAMDKSRKVEKGVGGFDIPITTNTSFVMTTYKMDNTINNILHNGLFQRPLFYNKEISEKDHQNIRKYIVNSRFGIKDKNYSEEKYIMKLIHKLKEMKNWYNEYKNEIQFNQENNDANKLVNMLLSDAESEYVNYVLEDKMIIDSIIRRMADNLQRLCILDNVSNFKTNIEMEVIRKTFSLVLNCVSSVQSLVMSQDKFKKRRYVILQLVAKQSISKTTLYNEMERIFKIKSVNLRIKTVKILIDAGYLDTYKSGRNEIVNITDKGRDYLVND